MPVGYYDRDRGNWVPLENGVVVQLLDTEPAGSPDGKVDALDADGDGYTNVEEYLNGTGPRQKIDYTNLGNNIDTIS